MIARISANALAEAAEFVAVQCPPGRAGAWVAPQRAMFKGLSYLNVEDREGRAMEDLGRGPSSDELNREGTS